MSESTDAAAGGARRKRITSDDAVKNLTGMPLSHASMPVAIAMCVLPHPTSP